MVTYLGCGSFALGLRRLRKQGEAWGVSAEPEHVGGKGKNRICLRAEKIPSLCRLQIEGAAVIGAQPQVAAKRPCAPQWRPHQGRGRGYAGSVQARPLTSR